MRTLLIVLLLLSPAAIFCQAVRYEISPVFQENNLTRLSVRVLLRGEADGDTEFALPNQFGAASQLSDCIQNLTCPTQGCTLLVNRVLHSAVVQHPPSADIELRYEVVQDFEGSDVTKDNAFRPMVQPTFFHILGSGLFAAPLFGDNSCELTLEWKGFPQNWLIHNSFGSQELKQRFQYAKTRLLEAVYVGGDFRVLRAEVQNHPVFLAIRGSDWAFSDRELLDLLQKTVEAQRNFWEDWDIPYYTVTLMPLAQLRPVMLSGGQMQTTVEYLGTGLRNSFAAFATPAPNIKVGDLLHLFHHELMHDWIGGKIRSGGGLNNMQFGWFSEGFTEYFAMKNMLAGGFISTEKYVKTLNEGFFKNLYTSQVGELPNSEIVLHFFKDTAMEALPYKRGFVFAFYLDNAIEQASGGQHGLRDFMLDLLTYYSAPNRDLLSNFDFFEQKLAEYLNSEAEGLIQKHIIHGKRIAPEAFVLSKYWHMETDTDGTPVLRLNTAANGWEKGVMGLGSRD